MFTLVSGLWQCWTQLNLYNILLVGVSGSGKSAFFQLLKRTTADDILPSSRGTRSLAEKYLTAIKMTTPLAPTVGLNAAKSNIQDGSEFQLWDLGGAKNLRTLWKHYFLEAHAVVFFVDAHSDAEALRESRAELYTLMTIEALLGVPFAIVVNRMAVDALTEAQRVHQLRRFSLQLGIFPLVHRQFAQSDVKSTLSYESILSEQQQQQQQQEPSAQLLATADNSRFVSSPVRSTAHSQQQYQNQHHNHQQQQQQAHNSSIHQSRVAVAPVEENNFDPFASADVLSTEFVPITIDTSIVLPSNTSTGSLSSPTPKLTSPASFRLEDAQLDLNLDDLDHIPLPHAALNALNDVSNNFASSTVDAQHLGSSFASIDVEQDNGNALPVIPSEGNTHVTRIFALPQIDTSHHSSAQIEQDAQLVLEVVNWLLDTLPNSERAGHLLTG